MDKTVCFVRVHGCYDMLVSIDSNKECRYLVENKYFPQHDSEIEAFVKSVEDDTSWENDCSYDDIFSNEETKTEIMFSTRIPL